MGTRNYNFIKKKCLICDQDFIAKYHFVKYCSDDCRKKASLEKYRKDVSLKMRNVKKPAVTLEQMAAEASEHGMTYGQYMVFLDASSKNVSNL